MGLFGRSLFTRKKTADEELYDFAKHGLLRDVSYTSISDINLMAVSGDDEIAEDYMSGVKKNNAAVKKSKPKTPKEVYNLETLNDKSYTLNTDPTYIEKNVKSLRKKAKLLPAPEKPSRDRNVIHIEGSYGASKYGRLEIESMIERLENRHQYAEYKDFFNQYPYTRSDLINSVIEAHTNLRAKRVEEFIPDLPDDAIAIMEAYNDMTRKVANKKAVFYIIADKKDFGENDKKRDPILLAQSPFALAWQILGAWDEEMIYLGDL